MSCEPNLRGFASRRPNLGRPWEHLKDRPATFRLKRGNGSSAEPRERLGCLNYASRRSTARIAK
jgi:hypothetical protein